MIENLSSAVALAKYEAGSYPGTHLGHSPLHLNNCALPQFERTTFLSPFLQVAIQRRRKFTGAPAAVMMHSAKLHKPAT